MDKSTSEKAIQVRFPFDVWEELRRLAKEHQRSFNGEVIWALRNYAARETENKKENQ
jgi:hypothetical protein